MIEEPVSREAIGKYVVYYNGCFAPRRDLKIVGVDDDGLYITFEWDGRYYTEHIMHIEAIIDNIGDEYDSLEGKAIGDEEIVKESMRTGWDEPEMKKVRKK